MPSLPALLAGADAHIEAIMGAVLVQLILIIVAARIFASMFRLLKQPTVVGEIAAGIVLGPSLFGYFFPELSAQIFDPSVNLVFGVLSQLGLILLLFMIGLEFDFGHLKSHGKAALAISLAGIALPFVLGLGLGPVMHPYLEPGADGQPVSYLGFVLFMGIAMSITAIPVLGRIMVELNIARTKIGSVTISAAAADDACGWILLASVSSIVQAQFQIWLMLKMLGLSLLFAGFMIYAARPWLKRFARQAVTRGRGEIGQGGLAILLVILFLCSLATNYIGIFAIFGAFLLGTVLSDEAEFRAALTRQLWNFLTVLLLPIFFTYTGLRTNVGSLNSAVHWLLFGGLMACAVLGKLGGCTLAARLGGFRWREALSIGSMMNTRGLTGLIVINVGLDLGVVPESVFCMLVLMALITTVLTTPLLLWLMKGTELEPYIRASGFVHPVRETSLPAAPTLSA